MDTHIKKLEGNLRNDNNDYLFRLIGQLEDLMSQDVNIPFNIKDINNKGFLIKVCGLFAFLSFQYMPWSYNDIDSWLAVYKSIKGKQFYGRVFKFIRDPHIIIFNAQVPQFKDYELVEGETYKGIIIQKYHNYLSIDIGHHFRWKCGSIVGLLNRSQLLSNVRFDDIVIGEEIEVKYSRKKDSGSIVFCSTIYEIDWKNNRPKYGVGDIVEAEIIKIYKEGSFEVLVEDTYKGVLTRGKNFYEPKLHKTVLALKKNLKCGYVILCEVIEIQDKEKMILLKWLIEFEAKVVSDKSICNILDDKSISTLTTLKMNIK